MKWMQKVSRRALLLSATIVGVSLMSWPHAANGPTNHSDGFNHSSRVGNAGSSVYTTPSSTAQEEDRGFWLVIRPTGFEVKELNVSAGDYFVVVQNATGLDRFGLRVERSTGERLYDLRLPRYKKYWKQLVTLIPGTYLITEANHPEWVCRVTVN